MKKQLFGLGSALLAATLLGATPAQAGDRHVDLSFSIGIPAGYMGVRYLPPPPPVYYYGPPVVYYPQNYYYPQHYGHHHKRHVRHAQRGHGHGGWKYDHRDHERYDQVEYRDRDRGDGDHRGRR